MSAATLIPPQPPVLSARNVTVEFPGRRGLFGRSAPVLAVDDLTLEVAQGEVVGLVGESGSGKTTLSRVLLGLQKPNKGQVALNGQPLSSLSRHDISREVQFIFQDPYSSLNPRHTVGRLIAQPMILRGQGTAAEQEKRVREMLDVVGLPGRMYDAYPAQLSGGQRQRVAIARALVLRPKILVCDEPTSALDVSIQAQVLNLMLELRREFGLTYLIVSHNMAVIEHMTTRVAVMYLGRLVEVNTSEEIFRNPQHPYTRLLLDSVMTVAPGQGIPDLKITPELRREMRSIPAFIGA